MRVLSVQGTNERSINDIVSEFKVKSLAVLENVPTLAVIINEEMTGCLNCRFNFIEGTASINREVSPSQKFLLYAFKIFLKNSCSLKP